jgi:hypothetical protein
MGLMPTQMQMPPQGAAPQEAPQGQDASRYTDETDSNVSPEEQEQYSKFEENYMRMIYTPNGEVNPDVMTSLSEPAPMPPEMEGQAPPPHIAALATTAVTIVQALDDSAREAGKPLTDDVLVQGGIAVIEELAEIAQAASIYDYSEDEMSGATTLAMNMYRDKAIADGRTDEQTLVSQWDEIQKANQEGRDNELLGAMEE